MTQQRKTGRFIEFLETLEERRGRGALAALRRGLGAIPGSVPEMHPYIAQWVSGESTSWREDVHYLVAALFAYYPQSWHRGDEDGPTNLGASFARIAKGEAHDSVERRFMVLLAVHREDLYLHLRHAISLLKARGQPVDWAQLLDDLKFWGLEDRRVQRRWARAFWGQVDTEDSAPDANT